MRNSTIFTRFSINSGALFFITLLTAHSLFPAEKVNHYRAHYKAALLADAASERILHHDRMHQKIYPASLVKMMVALIALEEIETGRISLHDSVKVSRWASKIGGHQVYLKQGEVFKFRELMEATVISSANDASVAIAEHILGSDKVFIKRMNDRAQELGMKNTKFYSVHGLPPSRGQKLDESCAYDLYLLALELIKHPQFLRWSSTRLESFRNGTFQLLNTNHRLIKMYRGMEGMKTGYHRRAGFNLVSSAKRDGQRYISIVLGAKSSRMRSKITRYLLDYGFDNYQKFKLSKIDTDISYSADIKGGQLDNVSLQATDVVSLLLSDEEHQRLEIWPKIPAQTRAPVKAEQKLGKLEYWLDGQLLKEVSLQTEFAVPEQSILSELTSMLSNLNGTN